MIRFVFRFLGLLCLAATFIVVVYDGTKSIAGNAFVFTSVRHLDEPADGQWTLVVKDRRAATVGSITSWQLRIYGRQ